MNTADLQLGRGSSWHTAQHTVTARGGAEPWTEVLVLQHGMALARPSLNSTQQRGVRYNKIVCHYARCSLQFPLISHAVVPKTMPLMMRGSPELGR